MSAAARRAWQRWRPPYIGFVRQRAAVAPEVNVSKHGLAALAILALLPIAAGAGEARAVVAVSAVVPARASLEAVAQPAALEISDQDVARGYVEVAALYRVRNNDPAGYLLRLAPVTGLARSVEVHGLASAVSMGQDLVEVTQPAALQTRDLDLRFRFVLDPRVPPGVYPMPVQLSVTTL